MYSRDVKSEAEVRSCLLRQVVSPLQEEVKGFGVVQAQHDRMAPAVWRLGDRSRVSARALHLCRSVSASPHRMDSLISLQRICGNRCARRVLALARDGDGDTEVLSEIEGAIQAARGGGQALEGAVRAQMESALDADFSGVRVHTDGQADALNQALSARAFTTGQDIFFKQGEYRPGMSTGQELLAHELTHVVQQTGDEVKRRLTVGAPDDEYEKEADQVALALMRREAQPIRTTSKPDGLCRQMEEEREGEEQAQTKTEPSSMLLRIRQRVRLSGVRRPTAHGIMYQVRRKGLVGSILQMARLRDYLDADPAHDPSRLSDAEIEATNEYRAYMDPALIWQSQLHLTRDEALLACRLILRALRQGESLTWQADARTFAMNARRQLGVTTEATAMVGQQMTWVPSGPGSGNTFETWASAASEGTAPDVASLTRINCWEMVLLAAYRAGMVTWQWIHNLYTASTSGWSAYLVATLSRGTPLTYTASDPNTSRPLRGDIVFFNGAAHVALATGETDGLGRSKVISFWPPPGTAFASGGTLDNVKVTTIEELNDYWTTVAHRPAFVVTFASAPW
jgi:hypothetical protein